MSNGYLSPEDAAKLRLQVYCDAISRDGETRIPLDPRCHSCCGNAVDVGLDAPIKFAQRHGYLPGRRSHLGVTRSYRHLSVWHSHVCPLEGESTLQQDKDGKKSLPDWVTPTTPYFMYSRTEAPEYTGDNPVILRVFIRPCSLCDAKDPFGYIALYLSQDYTEQSTPHDLESILMGDPPRVPLADMEREGRAAEHLKSLEMLRKIEPPLDELRVGPLRPRDGKGLSLEELLELIDSRADGPASLSEKAVVLHPNGTDFTCLNCDRQQPKAHKFCVGCGTRLLK